MTIQSPFQPARGANIVVSPSATSATTAIAGNNKSIRFVNSGFNICYVRVSETAEDATTADLPVLPKESIVIEKKEVDNSVSYISALGTTLNIQPGEGGW